MNAGRGPAFFFLATQARGHITTSEKYKFIIWNYSK